MDNPRRTHCFLPHRRSSSSSSSSSLSSIQFSKHSTHIPGNAVFQYYRLPIMYWRPLFTCHQPPERWSWRDQFRHVYVPDLSLGVTPEIRALTGMLKDEREKPAQSYIGLIATAILEAKEKRLLLGDIYKWVLKNYPYFRSRGSGWRNSIRHNLSLNDCFVKAGRSSSGKGHYWSIHKANMADFSVGDFRRKKALRKARRAILKMAAQEKEKNQVDEGNKEENDLPTKCPSTSSSEGHGVNIISKCRGFDVKSLLGIDQ